MYTLLELQSKTLGALKEIGYELNVFPKGDRRCRQSWIDALVGVNPPLLKLLEASPAVSVEQVEELIAQVAKTSPGVEVDPVSEPISQVAKTSPGVEVDPVSEPIDIQRQELIAQAAENITGVEVDRAQEPIMETVEASPAASVDPVQEPIAQAAENIIGVEVDRAQEPIMETVEASPAAEAEQAQESIVPAVQTFPGVELDSVQEPLAPAVKTKKRTQKLIEFQAQEPLIVKVVNILKLKTPEELSDIAWEFFNQSPAWLKEALYFRMDDCCEEVGFVEMIIRSFCRNALCGCNFNNIFGPPA